MNPFSRLRVDLEDVTELKTYSASMSVNDLIHLTMLDYRQCYWQGKQMLQHLIIVA